MALTKISGSILKDPLNLGGEVSIGGTLTYQDVTNVDSVGLGTFRNGINVTAGVSTFAAAIDANGGANIAGGLVVNSAKISDLTDNRVVIAGASGELEDSANFTFDASNILTATETGTGNGMGGIRAATANAGGNAGYGFITNSANRFAVTTIGSAGAESLRVYDDNNNAERLRIKSDGNVLMTGNGVNLDFKTTSNYSSNAIRFFDHSSSSSSDGRVQYEHSSNEILFETGGNWRARIGSTYFKPESNNTTDLGTDGQKWKTLYLGTQLNIDAVSGSSTGMIMLDNGGTNFARLGHNSASGVDVFDIRSDGHMRFLTNGNNERVRITSGGRLLIGTSTSNISGSFSSVVATGASGNNGGFQVHYDAGAYGGGSMTTVDAAGGGLDFWTYTGNIGSEANYNRRLRIDSSGHVSLRNSANSHQELQWYVNTTKSASIGWGNGSANWEFKHFRQDNQADNPYANIDFFTGSTTSPTRALRITEDGNHIREKHSRFATRILYSSQVETAGVKLTFKSPHVNIGSDFSSSRYTAPVDGSYAFWFHTNVSRVGSGAFYAEWKVNGSGVSGNSGGRIYDQHTGSGWNNLSGCIMLNLQEGDYVEVYNGSVEVNYDGNNYGQFMGWLVG